MHGRTNGRCFVAWLGLCALVVIVASGNLQAQTSSAAADLAAWGKEPLMGPEGRKLPVSGTWASSPSTNGWDDRYLKEMIEKGHHVLLTLEDPDWLAMTRGNTVTHRDFKQHMAMYYRPALEYARDHNLPISFRGWNWDNRIMEYEDWFIKSPDAEKPQMLVNGKIQKVLDPFGPIKAWQTWGKFYCGHDVMQELQKIYPNPPLVVFLNNNEGSKVDRSDQIPDNYERFVAEYGAGPHSREFKEKAIREGYQKRWTATFQAARDALIEPAWKKNVRFVSYNVLWDSGAIGDGNTNKRPRPGIWFDNEKGWLDWKLYDGAMPELYDNDWQPGKTDHTPTGMQMEAMNYYAAKERILKEDPNFLWTSIVWDGAVPNHTWSGYRDAGKTFSYVTKGQRWDAARYEGWIQFCLWTTRPSIYFEFRAPGPRNALTTGTWDALLRTVDRPWNNTVLQEFWRNGTLVPNTFEPQGHYYTLSPSHPQWLKDTDRWFLLTCDANPPRADWDWQKTIIRVYSEALVLGEAPNRRWMIYAHAPMGAVANATVKLPGFGDVLLPSVPKSGSFFQILEADKSVKTLIAGGPDELLLKADRQWAKPDEPVTFDAAISHAPGKSFTGFIWTFGDGATLTQGTLAKAEHRFAKAGEYLVKVEGQLTGGGSLSEQVTVFVGERPANTVLYDLTLNDALAWEGPWDARGADHMEVQTYRHLPNRGTAPNPVIVGGRFVDDPDRGRVWELTDESDGIFLKADAETSLNPQGHANKTVSLWFKASDLQGRQVLYTEGHHFPDSAQAAGFNIYLDGGTLYAGSWATRKQRYATWMNYPGIEAGRWYQVTLQLKDATADVQPDKLHLFIDGKSVASAPGVRVPGTYGPPRVGRTRLNPTGAGESLTLFHDQKLNEDMMRNVHIFHGRIDDFRLINAAVEP